MDNRLAVEHFTPGGDMRAICALVLLTASGCAYYTSKFTLVRELPLSDTSAIQFKARKPFSRIIVLRPSGDNSSGFEGLVASFEREFLRRGVTVISGAVTGRIVLGRDATDPKSEGAAQLTDIERALVMARGTGADAVLQIGKYEVLDDVENRFLVYAPKAGVREVSRAEYVGWAGPKLAIYSDASIFAGRLIDVSSGEVVASFKLGCASLWSLPADLHGEASITPTGPWKIYNTNFPFYRERRWDPAKAAYVEAAAEWEREGRARCDQRIIDRLVALSLSEEPAPRERNESPPLEL